MDEPQQLNKVQCPIADHRVLLSFTNDEDAQEFREWWALEGWDTFKTWHESGRFIDGKAT